jgi:glycosyltransferase involved in cell wall biosynthesis
LKKVFKLKKGDRVAILVQNLPVPFDRRVWQEAKHLRDLGLRVTVICPDAPNYPRGKHVVDGIEVRRYRSAFEADKIIGYLYEYVVSIFSIFYLLSISQLSGRFRVIQYCNPPDLLFLSVVPSKLLFRARIIFDQHDLGPELMAAKGFSKRIIMAKLSLLFEKMSYLTADHVISTNLSYRQIAITRGKKNPDDVFVVRSGPSRSWADAVRPDNAFRRGHKYQIGYIGVMGYQDGVDLLIKSIEILVKRDNLDVYLVLAGGGTEFEVLRNLTDDLGLSNNVEFYGKISDDVLLRNLIASSDVCAAADRKNELNDLSTMNKIIEYMALSKPTVLFESKEGRFSAGDSALYALPDDPESLASKLKIALEDATLREKLGKTGRARFEQHLCWENQLETLRLAYWGEELQL